MGLFQWVASLMYGRTGLGLGWFPSVIISGPLESQLTSKAFPVKYQTLSGGRIGRWRDGGIDRWEAVALHLGIKATYRQGVEENSSEGRTRD